MSVPSGWWKDDDSNRDDAGDPFWAHFYPSESSEIAWPICTPEPIPDAERDRWADLVITVPEDDARTYIDLGDAMGKPCPECLAKLGEGEGSHA